MSAEPDQFSFFASLCLRIRGRTDDPLALAGLGSCSPGGLPTRQVVILLPDLSLSSGRVPPPSAKSAHLLAREPRADALHRLPSAAPMPCVGFPLSANESSQRDGCSARTTLNWPVALATQEPELRDRPGWRGAFLPRIPDSRANAPVPTHGWSPCVACLPPSASRALCTPLAAGPITASLLGPLSDACEKPTTTSNQNQHPRGPIPE